MVDPHKKPVPTTPRPLPGGRALGHRSPEPRLSPLNGGESDFGGEVDPLRRRKAENPLQEITRSFLLLLSNSPKEPVNLNDAAGKLNVSKRRIYDITNVLEGIGYIEKVRKNTVRLKSAAPPAGEDRNPEAERAWRTQMDEAEKEARYLDSLLGVAEKELGTLKASPEYKSGGYATYEDILAAAPQETADVLAIQAALGTVLELEGNERAVTIRGEEEVTVHRVLADGARKAGEAADADNNLLLSELYR